MAEIHLREGLLSRRQLLLLSATGATALAARRAFPSSFVFSEEQQNGSADRALRVGGNLYSELIKTWCDGLLEHQVTTGLRDPALIGGFLCPACALIHVRCSDAVYPLLHVAQTTGDARYVRAAQLVYEWSERQVSRSDGSWVNDVSLQDWQGITVFRAVAIAEALHHYG